MSILLLKNRKQVEWDDLKLHFYKVAPKTNNLHTFYWPAGGDTSDFKKRTNYIVNCTDLYNIYKFYIII